MNLFEPQYPNIFLNVYSESFWNTVEKRLYDYRNFYFFYLNDNYEIEKYIRKFLTDKKIYDAKGIEDLVICHTNIIDKTLNRECSGIYDSQPTRVIKDKDGKVNIEATNKLEKVLKEIKYSLIVKDAFRQSKFFNITETLVNYNSKEKKLFLDVLNPAQYCAESRDTDYLEKAKIIIGKSKTVVVDGKAHTELYTTVWTDELHYNLDAKGNSQAIEGNEGMKNPYGMIPSATLRFKKGFDYYGEPDWDLFNTQVRIDILKTSNFPVAVVQNAGIWLGTNLEIPANETIKPNTILQRNKLKNDDLAPDLKNIAPNINFEANNDNLDFLIEDLFRSKGISSTSASLDTKPQSGTAKVMDEIELQETREDNKEILYYFEVDLLNIIRVVHNKYASKDDKIPDGDIDVQFSEEKQVESYSDKSKRREDELKWNLKTEKDFIAEDREIDEKAAEGIFNQNKTFNDANRPVVNAVEDVPFEKKNGFKKEVEEEV